MFQYDYKLKICMVGSSGVGKSSLAQRIVTKNQVNIANIGQTIGLDFLTTYFSYNDKEVKIDIWDTAGHERFLSITRSYYKHGDIYLLIFDLNNYKIEKDIDMWINEIKNSPNYNDKPIFIIGNKYDLLDKNNLDASEKIINLKNDLNNRYPFYPSFFISVANGKNIEHLLECILENVNFQNIRRGTESVLLNEDPNKDYSSKKNCC